MLAICDRCGFEYSHSQLKKEWTGLMVCHGAGTNGCWEPRHPQEFVRGVRDDQGVRPNMRPEPADVFIETSNPDLTFEQAFASPLPILEQWFKDNVRDAISAELTGATQTATVTLTSQAEADAIVGQTITGSVVVDAPGLTVGPFGLVMGVETPGSTVNLLTYTANATGSTFRYITIDGIDSKLSIGIGGPSFVENMTFDYIEIKRCGFDAIRFAKNSAYRYIYAHDMRLWVTATDGVYNGNGPQTTYAHLDIGQALRSGVTVENSWLVNTTGDSATSVLIFKSDTDEQIVGATIRKNYIRGATNYPLHIVSATGILAAPGPYGWPEAIVIDNNRVDRDYGGYGSHGPFAVGSVPSANITFSSNVWADTGEAIQDPPHINYPLLITTSPDQSVQKLTPFSVTLETSYNTPTWAIIGGADQASFSLVGNVLSYLNPPAGTYEVIVRATDEFAQTADITITLLSGEEWNFADYFLADLLYERDASEAASISLTGSAVTNWADLVNAVAATASGPAQRPTYSATARNGLPGISSDGASDVLVQTDVTDLPVGQQAISYVIQAYGDASLSSGFKYHLSDAEVGGSFRSVGSGSGNTRFQGSGSISTSTYAGLDRSIVISIPAGATPTISISVDGETAVSTATAVSAFTPTRHSIGAQGSAADTYGNFSQTTHQHYAIINRALTADEIDMCHGYLAHKWQGSRTNPALPTDHPYYNGPPVI